MVLISMVIRHRWYQVYLVYKTNATIRLSGDLVMSAFEEKKCNWCHIIHLKQHQENTGVCSVIMSNACSCFINNSGFNNRYFQWLSIYIQVNEDFLLGKEGKQQAKTWGQIEKIAQDRRKWKSFVDDLCPGMDERVLSQVSQWRLVSWTIMRFSLNLSKWWILTFITYMHFIGQAYIQNWDLKPAPLNQKSIL